MIELISFLIIAMILIFIAKFTVDIRRLNDKVWPPDEPEEISQ